ncbi:MAG: hypothetical protein ACOY90_08120 [Candidatus Zhuqueibacterota bacterium]
MYFFQQIKLKERFAAALESQIERFPFVQAVVDNQLCRTLDAVQKIVLVQVVVAGVVILGPGITVKAIQVALRAEANCKTER